MACIFLVLHLEWLRTVTDIVLSIERPVFVNNELHVECSLLAYITLDGFVHLIKSNVTNLHLKSIFCALFSMLEILTYLLVSGELEH